MDSSAAFGDETPHVEQPPASTNVQPRLKFEGQPTTTTAAAAATAATAATIQPVLPRRSGVHWATSEIHHSHIQAPAMSEPADDPDADNEPAPTTKGSRVCNFLPFPPN